MKLADEFTEYVRKFREIELIDLVPTLTLISLLVNRIDTGEVHYVITVLAVAGLVLPGLHRSSLLWFAIAAALGLRVFIVAHNLDNHGFLLAWWTLALGCAYSLEDPGKAFTAQARLLIGFSFLFACLWKGVLSNDYLTGDFFHLTFLNDWRFTSFTRLVGGGIGEAALGENRAVISKLREAGQALEPVALQTTPQLRTIAIVATWWTLAIEALVAIQFLVPVGWKLGRHRDATLMIFAVTTYAVAPVMGFGWLLMTLGIAQTTRIEYESFVPAFQDAGAAIVVSTIASVLGRQAGPAAVRIVEEIAKVATEPDPTFGKAMLNARRKLLAAGTPMVLGLTSYGDADWRIRRAADGN